MPNVKVCDECVYCQMEQKAEEQARQNVLSKKKKAMQERIAKERAQKENMKKYVALFLCFLKIDEKE